MNKYIIFNKFLKMNLYIENELDISKKAIIDYIEPYIYMVDGECFSKNYIKVKRNEIEIFFNEDRIIYKESNILLLKRIIIDIFSRIIENKRGIFLHSSSLSYNNQSIVFIGNRGSGKTTTLLNLLNLGAFEYSSNDSTAIYIEKNKVYTYGNPSSLNVRVNTLFQNKSLYDKIMTVVDKEEIERNTLVDIQDNCSEHISLSYQSLLNIFSIKPSPNNELKCIINLVFDEKEKFKLEKVDFQKFKYLIEKNLISGVNVNRTNLEKIISKNNIDLDELNSYNIDFYNLYKNNNIDFSKELIKRLKYERSIN